MRPIETCELCGRSARLTKHHKKKKDWKVGINLNHTAMFCRECHGKVHATFSEKELDLTYSDLRQDKSCRFLTQRTLLAHLNPINAS